jgi:hypothetical protein
MYFTKTPSRRIPSAPSISPDRNVASTSPSTPCRITVAATSTMNAPAGPPIWYRLPPSADTRKPPTIAATSPRSGDTPEAMAMAIDRGSATTATVSPARRSARNPRSP